MSNIKVKVDGISIFANVQSVNKMSGKFEVNLVVDDEAAKILEDAGLTQAKKITGELVEFEGYEGKKVFKFKKATQTREGKPMSPPVICDSQGSLSKELVGNGSKVRLYGSAYAYTTPAGKKGVAGGLDTLQIIELVTFGGSDEPTESPVAVVVDTIEGAYVAAKEAPATKAPDVDII